MLGFVFAHWRLLAASGTAAAVVCCSMIGSPAQALLACEYNFYKPWVHIYERPEGGASRSLKLDFAGWRTEKISVEEQLPERSIDDPRFVLKFLPQDWHTLFGADGRKLGYVLWPPVRCRGCWGGSFGS